MDGARPVRSPRGTTLTARSWQTEAPLRMLQNNLDPEVAERPDDLVVYGGTGRAARDWRSFDAMVRTLTTLNGGCGGMGGAQPLAVTLNGGVCLVVDVDETRLRRRVEHRYLDEVADDLDAAVERCTGARRERRALSVGLVGNCATVFPELLRRGVEIDIVTDQTSAHDPLSSLP